MSRPWLASWSPRSSCAPPPGWSAWAPWRWTAPSGPATPPGGPTAPWPSSRTRSPGILRQADQADQQEDREHGTARGDELPAALANKAGRLARLRPDKALPGAEGGCPPAAL